MIYWNRRWFLNYIERSSEKKSAGKAIVEIKHDLRDKWHQIHFGDIQIDNTEDGYLFHVQLLLNGIDPDNVLVELYAEGMKSEAPEKIKMEADSIRNSTGYTYQAQVKTTRSANEYTARVIPSYQGISIPLEDNLILWQR
jgi:starch phosphorylase